MLLIAYFTPVPNSVLWVQDTYPCRIFPIGLFGAAHVGRAIGRGDGEGQYSDTVIFWFTHRQLLRQLVGP